MTVWVVRKSPDGSVIGAPRLCAKPGRVARVRGLLTIEEQIATLLAADETAQDLGAVRRWKIVAGSRHTGFIEILDTA
jgi:hypothetical protein